MTKNHRLGDGHPGTGYPTGGAHPIGKGYPTGGPGGGGHDRHPLLGYPNSADRTWALVAHFGGAAGAFFSGGTLGWIVPLLTVQTKGQRSPVVRAHAVAAANFQLLWSIVAFVCWIVACVGDGFSFAPIATITTIVCGLIGGAKANAGRLYRYPLSVSMIK